MAFMNTQIISNYTNCIRNTTVLIAQNNLKMHRIIDQMSSSDRCTIFVLVRNRKIELLKPLDSSGACYCGREEKLGRNISFFKW